MATIVDELVTIFSFKVDKGKLGSAKKGVQEFKGEVKKTSQRLKDIRRGILEAFGVTAIVQATKAVASFSFNTVRSFETLRASLKTVTGSAEAGAEAFALIKNFAKETPFSVEQITSAFIKLKALGLEPSEESLRSFGNTASAMGKTLDQFVEAVADAVTGEFERLKEFGIKARSEGDNVAFTFQGVTTTVGKNAKEIEAFLKSIGEQQFAGAMGEQMGTLNGIISNLKDNFQAFILEVAESGPLVELRALLKDLRDRAGGSQGLAKAMGESLARGIRAVRQALPALIEALKLLVQGLAFAVENADLLMALFVGTKTTNAFSVITGGFEAMGLAAKGALGPIGLIAGALTALIPLAIKAGSAIGDTLAATPGQVTTKKRGGVIAGSFRTAKASQEVLKLQRQLDKAKNAAERRAIGGSLSQAKLRLRDAEKSDAKKRKKQAASAAEFQDFLDTQTAGIQASAGAAVDPNSPLGKFSTRAAKKGKAFGATPKALKEAERAFRRSLAAGGNVKAAEKAGLAKLRKLSGVKGTGKKKKKDLEAITDEEFLKLLQAAPDARGVQELARSRKSPTRVPPIVTITNIRMDNSVTLPLEGMQSGDLPGFATLVSSKVADALDTQIRLALDSFRTPVRR